MKNIIYAFSLFFLVFSCIEKKTDIPTIDISNNAIISIDQLSDSSFIGDISSIYYENNRYYISDFKRDDIYILDNDFNLKNSLGRRGKGPGEFLGASHLFVNKYDSIFVFNEGKNTIEIFNKNTHLSSVKLPDGNSFASDMRFCYLNKNLYLGSFNGTNSLCKYSLVSNNISWFGNIKKYSTTKETRIKNRRHLFLFNNNKIIAVPDCQPKIEIYDLMGKEISNYNIDTIPIVNRFLHFINTTPNSINSYYQFFSDICVRNDNLFILVLSLDKKNKISSDKIIQIKIINNKIIPKQILYLGNGWYSRFCVTNNNIVAFNAKTGELTKYKFNLQ